MMSIAHLRIESHKWILLSGAMLLGVGLVVYHPVLGVGFWTDDYELLGIAAKLRGLEYLQYYFDPRIRTIWYRPIQGLELGIEYLLFGNNPFGYHVVQLLLHIANCLIFLGLVTYISRNWRAGFLSALIYATLPTYTLAVSWATVADPLLGFFMLATVWLWTIHLRTGNRAVGVSAIAAFVVALLTKEVAATLPILLFLIDWQFINKQISLGTVVRRYAVFPIVLVFDLLLEFNALTQGPYARDSGYGLGVHIFPVLTQYLARLVFPWDLGSLWSYVLLAAILGALMHAAITRRTNFFFTTTAALLTLLPVLPFRIVQDRYLYVPLLASSVGFGLMSDVHLSGGVFGKRWVRGVSIFALTLVVLSGGSKIGDDAENLAGLARQTRLHFRPILQNHPTFEADTLLYFADPPFSLVNVSGLFAMQYGSNVILECSCDGTRTMLSCSR